MALTNRQKSELAAALLMQAGNLVEFRDHYLDGDAYEGLRKASSEDIAAQLSTWLKRLPGDYWDSRLPL